MASGDSIFSLPGDAWHGPPDGEPVAGDVAAVPVNHKGRVAWQFDDTAEAAIVTAMLPVPKHYGGGNVTITVHYYTASDNAGTTSWDFYADAKTPNSDTFDMEAADPSWDTGIVFTDALGGTAGDPLTAVAAAKAASLLDNMAVGDIVQFALRFDGPNSTSVAGNIYVSGVEITED